MTNIKKIKKGDRFVCLHPRITTHALGTVIAITSNPSKQIGLELDEPVGFHSCDGRGKDKYCIWVRTTDIFTQEEYENNKVITNTKQSFEDLEELILRND